MRKKLQPPGPEEEIEAKYEPAPSLSPRENNVHTLLWQEQNSPMVEENVRFSDMNTPRYLNSVSGSWVKLLLTVYSGEPSRITRTFAIRDEILGFLANSEPMSSTELSGPLIHGPDIFPCFSIDHRVIRVSCGGSVGH